MTGWQLTLTWNFYPSVVIGCLLILAWYLWRRQWKFDGKALNFTLGVLTVFISLCSPIDVLSDGYLFSAHMLQHMLLHLVAPALMVSGLPESFVRAWLKFPLVASLERFFGNPILAVAIAVATFWIWHYAPFYDATVQSEPLHIFEHLTFLVSGTILWWPVWKPIPEGRLAPAPALAYIFAAAVADGLLGVIFSLADTTYYAVYANPPDPLRLLPMIREQWDLTQLSDQKLGGAIMWGFGSVIFVWALMEVMIRWFKEEPESEAPQPVPNTTE